MDKETLKRRIRELQKDHIESNGFGVSSCKVKNCYYKQEINKLKKSLKLKSSVLINC